MFTRRALPLYAIPGYGLPEYAIPFNVSAVSPPTIPGVELTAGWQRPHYSVHNTRPHCAIGWQRPHYEVKEEA